MPIRPNEPARFAKGDQAIDNQTGYRVTVEDAYHIASGQLVLAVRDGNRWRYRKTQDAFTSAEA